MFAERYKSVKSPEITFICREFLRENDLTEKSSDYNFMFLKLFVTTLPNNHENIPGGWVSYLQIFTRRFIKFPKHPDIFNGLGLVLKMISIIKARTTNELNQNITKLTSDLYPFLCHHTDIVEALITNDMFFGMELDFFRSIKIESNLNLVNSFKKLVLKRLSSSLSGCLLVDDVNSHNIFDLYTKLSFGDFSDFESQELSLIDENYLMTYEIFSKLAAQNSCDRAVDDLLELWKQSYFISDFRHQIWFMNLLKISLLSQTSDGLGEILKRSVNLSGPFTVTGLCLLTCFPFSLWRSLEKSSVK